MNDCARRRFAVNGCLSLTSLDGSVKTLVTRPLRDSGILSAFVWQRSTNEDTISMCTNNRNSCMGHYGETMVFNPRDSKKDRRRGVIVKRAGY
jgi:hypothetical protein